MIRTRLLNRTVTVSAAFVLAFGAAGITASAAFAAEAVCLIQLSFRGFSVGTINELRKPCHP